MQNKKAHGFTRRSFVKGAAVLTASGALVGCSPNVGNLEESTLSEGQVEQAELYAGVCRGNCAGGCFLNVHVRDGQIVRTSSRELPDPRYTRICSKGLTHVGRIYSAERLKYPMKRIGERGKGEFEKISWDEALDTIADKWMEYTEKYGPESMAVMYGSGNYAICSGVGLASATNRFMNVVGCSYIPLNVDAAHGRAFGIITGMTPYGTNNEPADYINAKTIICWGANPPISQPQVMHFILEAKDNGSKYIVIDPMYNANAAKADWFMPVKASTDGVLAFGVLNEIFAQGWIDEEFVRNHTEAPLLVKDDDGKLLRMSDLGVSPIEGDINPATGEPTLIDPYVVWDEANNTYTELDKAERPALEDVGEVEGFSVKTTLEILKERAAEYSFEQVTEITGVSEEDVKELARVYAEEGPVITYAMFGDDHYVNGHYNYWPIYAVSFLTGNMGKSGAGCGFSELIPANVANFAGTLMPQDSEGNMVQGQGLTFTINEVGNTIDSGEYGGQPITLKGCYITNANPITNMAEHEYTISWINKLEFVVVAEQSMTETALYADILLPAAHWFEQTDLFVSYSSAPFIEWNEKATEPLFESKPDFEIYKLLSEKMGYGEFFDMTAEEYIELWIDSDGARALGITYEKLKEDKAAKILPGDPFVSFEGGTFATETQRARLYQDIVIPDYNVGQDIDESKEYAPYWEPPLEASELRSIRETYPFHLISEHMRTRTHTQWWDVDVLKDYEPEPVIKINPEDADEYGIVAGDHVRVFNDRGYVVMKAVINAGAPRGTLSAPRGWGAHEYIEGHFASLPPKQFNQVNANQAFNDVAVNIEKV